MIEARERARMLRAYSIGPRMIHYLEEAGIERLEDLAGANPEELAMRIDIVSGRRPLNRFGHEALRNLVELANRECRPPLR
jgi:hypothetical protein